MKEEKAIGVKFLLVGGHFLNVPLPESAAKEFVGHHIQGKLPLVIGGTAHFDNDAMIWSIASKDIVAIHTFDVEELAIAKQFNKMQAAQLAAQQKQMWQTSGLRN